MKKVIGLICCFALFGPVSGAEKVATGVRGELLSLGVDSDGLPSLGYIQVGDGVWYIAYAKRDGGWTSEHVDSSGMVGGDNAAKISLALDQNDKPGLAYGTPRAGGQLCYAYKSGGSWQVSDLVTTAPSWPTLRYYLGAMPYIVYARDLTEDKTIMIGKPEGSNWKWDSTAIGHGIDSPDQALDFFFDKKNQALVVFIYNELNNAKVVRSTSWSGSSWTVPEPIDSTGFDPNEYGVHMALAPNGQVGIVYAHQDSTTLEPYQMLFSSNNGTGWLPVNAVDVALFKTVSQGLNSGPALAFDTLNRPHVFYLAGATNAWQLRHAWREGSTWKKETLVNLGFSYVWRIEAAIDRENRIHCAYTAGDNVMNIYYYGPGATGVDEQRPTAVDPELSVSAGLVHGAIQFALPGVERAEVSVYNSAGMIVRTVAITHGTGSLDAKSIPAGAYFARVAGSRAAAVKFIAL